MSLEEIEQIDYIVDDSSPKIENPEDITISLKEHQLAMIYKMSDLEKPDMKKLDSENSEWFKTDFGALCDKVGSGKSLTILGLIANNKQLYPDEKCLKSFGNMVHIYSKSQLYIPINMIVVPHGIVSQWEKYINDFTNLKNYVIKSNKVTQEFLEKLSNYRENQEEVFDMDIVLVSSTQYNKIGKIMLYQSWNDRPISISRLIIDEVDSIKIPSSSQILAEFTWFISSSDRKLQNPRGYTVYKPYTYENWHGDIVNTTRAVTVDKITHSGFFKTLLLNLEQIRCNSLKRQIYLKSKPEFVENSFKLPEIKSHIIKCLGNLYVNVLNGVVSQDIMNMINAGDISSAVEAIGCSTEDEEGLIKLVTKDLEKNLKNKQIEYDAKQQMTYSNETAKFQALEKIHKDIKEIEMKIKNIKDRIVDTEACPICCDEISNKVIVKCCNNAFCFECLTLSLSHKQACPLCRKSIAKKDIIVLKSDVEEVEEEMEEEDDDSKRTKIENLKKYVDKLMKINMTTKIKKNKKKILIFSEFEQSLNEIETYLLDSAYKYDKLKGSTTTINNKVMKYKGEETDILLLNSKYFGSGLNLENTTDIFMFHKMTQSMETQVIGRAQRPGRKNTLHVHRLFYENEM